MPFTLADLERLVVRVGMTDKTLREMSDAQFLAWLRNIDTQGTIGVAPAGSGRYTIPVEERVRVLNALEEKGVYVPGIMGSPPAPQADQPSPGQAALRRSLHTALAHLEEAHTLARQEQGRSVDRSVAQMVEGAMQVVARALETIE